MKRLTIAVLAAMMLCSMSLTVCSCVPFTKTEYVKQERPPLPERPTLYNVKWSKCYSQQTDSEAERLYYCLDEENAKALLKNLVLIFGHIEVLEKGWE